MCSSKSSRGGGPWSKGQGDHDGKGGVQNFFVGIITIHDGKPYEPASIEGQQGVLNTAHVFFPQFMATWMEKIFSSTNRFHCYPIRKQSKVTHFHNQTCQEETPNVHKKTMANQLDGWMWKQPRNWLKLTGKDTSLIPLKHGLNPTPFDIFQSMEWLV